MKVVEQFWNLAAPIHVLKYVGRPLAALRNFGQGLMLRLILVVLALLGTGVVSAAEENSPPENSSPKIDFARDIKPLFKNHCLDCHGPDAQEGGFRVDVRNVALDGGDSGLAIKKGDSKHSALIERVVGADPDLKMPPGDESLSKTEIDLLRAWIDQGANWPESESAKIEVDHWAFDPLTCPEVPSVKHSDWINNDLDHFVLARLEKEGHLPSPTADRYTLIRRLSLDLTGLAPTPDEVSAFVNDTSPEAYEKVVDRLLHSPHFGERWTRHWLDMARYADSDGYEKDNPRPNAWRYRDWVLDAINSDMPYDQFTREQLAGDLLENPTKMQQLATAFHRQTLTNTEGGTDQEQFRVEAVFDRVETTGAIWLGLTVGCARCHTHKYDPIAQREYFEMFAFFNNGDETNTNVPRSHTAVKEYRAKKSVHDGKAAELNKELQAAKEVIKPQLLNWISQSQARIATEAADPLNFHLLRNEQVTGPEGATFEKLEDDSWLATGKRHDSGQYQVTADLEATVSKPVVGFRIEVMPHESLPAKGPGLGGTGNFVLSEFRAAISTDGKSEALKFKDVRADFSQANFHVSKTVDGDLKTGWAIKPHYSKPHEATFILKQPLVVQTPQKVSFEIDHEYGRVHLIGRFKITAVTGLVPDSTLNEETRKLLAVANDQRSDADQQKLFDAYAKLAEPTKSVLAKIEAHKKASPQKPDMKVRVISQRTKEPRTTHVLRRGDFLQPMHEVKPNTLGVLHELKAKQETASRMDFVDWLFSEANSLTPRVAANQIWAKLLGKGIVSTQNDFGLRGEPPTHPQLLDWLSTEYRRLGWSRKAFIKTIVMSATYKQSSTHRAEFNVVDPLNKWLHRQNRFRVEGEIVRDISLQAAGLLSYKVGGPSVFPPLPPEIAELSYANNFKWKTSAGEDQYRRGMYTFFKRTAPHPNLINFDCPDSNTACLERRTSNTPLQALQSLNNEIFLESAQNLAKRLLSSTAQTDEERLETMVMLAASRPLKTDEKNSYLDLLSTAKEWYKTHPEDAGKLSAGLEKETIKEINEGELAAWIATCRVALNLDDFFTRP